MKKPDSIRVLLVDDSAIALEGLKKMLLQAPDIHVVGTARNGKEALELIPRLQPAVVCSDLHMPVMDGLRLTREIMEKFPRPILIVSASVGEGSDNSISLIEAGAVDVFAIPRGGLNSEFKAMAPELIRKIRVLSGVRVFRKFQRDAPHLPSSSGAPRIPGTTRPAHIVVIGASTGGPQAFQAILARLPADFQLPVVCVQHISEGFLDGFVKWLESQCKVKVRIAREGEHPSPGTVYFPRERTHLSFDRLGRFVFPAEPPCRGHRPSVTITMRSAAECFGPTVIGILLTGMGNDGVEGMREVARAGGITIAQDEESSVVFGMPREAIESGAARYVIPLEDISSALIRMQETAFLEGRTS